nr:hypothetical protein [Tanacetum cinerariifolium]
MMGNRALLTNFVEKFLETIRFGNNDFAVIAGYGDVVIGSMTIKKSTCFVRNDDGVDLLTGESSSSSLNDDVQQSPKEVILPQTNTQSISINMVPNGDEASTSHNVFNERLEDAYFDATEALRDADWSISNNMIPNGDEASTSHNVFNERLEDVYFDASTSFHDPFNVHTYYQPYPHEKKWAKDHPLHKIIGDP